MQTPSAAEELALALELGLVSVDEVIAWADAVIAESASPPYAIIEVAMSRRVPISELAHLLRETPGLRDPQAITVGILSRLAQSVSSGTTSPSLAAELLYALSFRRELPDMDNARQLDDSFCLARTGTCGTIEEATAELLAFLAPYRPQ